MAHPKRYADGDPLLARLREVCLAMPGAGERVSHGAPNWYTTKTFVTYGAHVKGDHDNDAFRRSMVFKPDADERAGLLSDERFFVPAYVGPSGWIGLNFLAADPDWDEVAELVDMSYRNTAGKRLIAKLDARHDTAR